jgi:uroporphyrin-3 C-methyltransferase
MDDNLNSGISTVPATPAQTRARAGKPLGILGIVLALLALTAAGYSAWGVYRLQHPQDTNSLRARLDQLGTQLDGTQRSVESNQRESESFRTRAKDIDGVNKSLREEVLGLSERTRLLEDAVTNLAEKRLSGHDALALNEAELLLLLGQQRFALFHDAAATIAAYRQADMALAETDDPAFVGVRQTVAAEIEALNAQQDKGVNVAVTAIDQLRGRLAKLPLAQNRQISETPVADESRLWRVVSQFVRVSHDQDVLASVHARGGELGGELIALDLSVAQSALLARDAVAYHDALQRVRLGSAQRYAATDPAVIETLAELDKLTAMPLAAPAPGILGSALKELRNLRITHALQRSPKAAPAVSAASAGQS